jgi:hypothetical protein
VAYTILVADTPKKDENFKMVRILRGNFTMESGLFLDSQVEI